LAGPFAVNVVVSQEKLRLESAVSIPTPNLLLSLER
jgi:hypothetical protein